MASSPSAGALSGAQQMPASVRRFFSSYVAADGRVVRRDQGGDTVSEGQGYAMLLAVAARDAHLFTTVWNWTRDNLQRPSALFAYRWAAGKIASATPATDADLQIAWALALAGRLWHKQDWLSEAKTIGHAIAQSDIGYDDQGAPVLAAGPWAVQSGRPAVAEPGYWTPPAAAALAQLTGDNRLKDLAAADLTHWRQLSGDGRTLPPDWAHIGAGLPATPVAAPDGSAPVQAGPDGLRAVVWAGCAGPAGRRLAAQWWDLLRPVADAAPLALTLDGTATNQDKAPLTAVSAAAAAGAAGDRSEMAHLLDHADAIDQKYPTYYGAAWAALGRVLLSTHLLATC